LKSKSTGPCSRFKFDPVLSSGQTEVEKLIKFKLQQFVPLLLLLHVGGCAAQRPVLYPNEYFKRAGRDASERQIDECLREAEDYVSSSNRAGEIAGGAAGSAGTSAAVGAAAGAAGGAVFGHAGRGAAAGAAGGAAGGLTRGAIRGISGSGRPDAIVRNYVNRCLREKGFDVIGWK
jgi:hypothetical protein